MAKKWDFSGWATRSGRRCSDGRTIRKNAFADCDGMTVPLVWSHKHDEPSKVLGHALLEARDGDMYAYCSFNETENGLEAKELVRHGDITQLSIYANNLTQSAKTPPCDVYHGVIREVSLVLAGANPGALIDNIMMHGEIVEDEAEIFHGEDGGLVLYHAEDEGDDDEETVADILNTLSDKQKAAVGVLIDELKHADDSETEEPDDEDDEDDDDEDIDDDTEDSSDEEDDETNDDSEEEEKTMKHNVFDTYENDAPVLSHDDMQTIFRDAKRLGSLKAAVEEHLEDGVLAHAVYNHDDDGNPTTVQTYGMADIRYLFPEAKNLNTPPEFIKRDNGWVAKVINGTHHTPFSRVKSTFADITMEEARAKGYTKGKKKMEEVFALLKRTTDPQTIYKKQKLDRDDIIDITDFDVVAWVKGEMRVMLDEELARAILIGDGRPASSDDKIKEQHIRPIFNDDDLFTVKVPVAYDSTAPNQGEVKAKALLDAMIRSRKLYKGSGNPIFFTTEDWLTEVLLLEDGIGHKLYKTEAEVATAMRVSSIVTVEPMEGQQIPITDSQTGTTTNKDFIGVYANLKDYNIGTNRGGQTTFFDDFDIDYNQQKYLLETRLSGALIKPYSAVSFYEEPQP